MLNRFLFSSAAPHVLRSGMMVVGSDSGRWMNDFYYSNLFQISFSLSLSFLSITDFEFFPCYRHQVTNQTDPAIPVNRNHNDSIPMEVP